MSIIQRIEERMSRAWHDKGPHHVPTVLMLTSEEANALRTELGFDKDDRHQVLDTGYQITTECGTVLATPEALVERL